MKSMFSDPRNLNDLAAVALDKKAEEKSRLAQSGGQRLEFIGTDEGRAGTPSKKGVESLILEFLGTDEAQAHIVKPDGQEEEVLVVPELPSLDTLKPQGRGEEPEENRIEPKELVPTNEDIAKLTSVLSSIEPAVSDPSEPNNRAALEKLIDEFKTYPDSYSSQVVLSGLNSYLQREHRLNAVQPVPILQAILDSNPASDEVTVMIRTLHSEATDRLERDSQLAKS